MHGHMNVKSTISPKTKNQATKLTQPYPRIFCIPVSSFEQVQYIQESMGSVIFTMFKVSQNQSHVKLQKGKSLSLKENCGVIELYGFQKHKII